MRPVPPAHGQLPPSQPGGQFPWQALLQWKIVVPAFVLVAVLAVALGVQPAPPPSASGTFDDEDAGMVTFATASPEPTLEPAGTVEALPSPTVVASAEVASARSTPTVASDEPATIAETEPTPDATVADGEPATIAEVEPTTAPTEAPDPELLAVPAQCGEIAEANHVVAVEQTLAGMAVRATNAAVYPVEYFRCILLATGGKEATDLAVAIGKAEREGATHAVLVDLWLMNNGRDFAQVDLRNASFAAAGGNFPTLGVFRGKAEVVVAEGQSRGVTLIATVTAGFGATTGPVTVSIEAPLVGGAATPGKYQLFLPTP